MNTNDILQQCTVKSNQVYLPTNLPLYVIAVEINRLHISALQDAVEDGIIYRKDFLNLEVQPSSVDRVVMNPPFSKQQDIQHVTQALKWLKPGGVLVAIMSKSYTFRDNQLSEKFRIMLERKDAAVTPIQAGAFTTQ